MKVLVISFILFFLVSACSHNKMRHTSVNNDMKDTIITVDKPIAEGVSVDINLSIKAEDYRLYATSGRSITLPGIAIEKVAKLIKRCGIKYFSETGDVIKSDNQRSDRKKRLSYMKQYNQQIVKYCLK